MRSFYNKIKNADIRQKLYFTTKFIEFLNLKIINDKK